MEQPLVSVICISYNHEAFVYKALSSLRNQHYPNVEIIIADDCSIDQTREEIQRFLSDHPGTNWKVIFNPTNQGNCKTFNMALAHAKGKYVMDFSADDLLYNPCLEKLVNRFEQLADHYAVVFSNVDLVDVKENFIAKHYMTHANGKAIQKVPQGEVYRKIVKRYFISPVGMMMKRSVLLELGGYDETLAYEDFDFWVRSSRLYHYAYVDECLAAKRETPHSLSKRFLKKGNDRMFESTAIVCQKIEWLNRTPLEDEALVHRVTYEIRQSILYRAHKASVIYLKLMKQLHVHPVKRAVYKLLMLLVRYV